ncbi:MAG: DUF262 domain-containing protein [Bdellovibrionales bacterium]|nr:DUF262 domain-containing protein [Bdellovibrionales bacterium]
MQSIQNPGLKTVQDLLEDHSQFIIPDYQREYTWKNEDLLRLLETLIYDINLKKEVTFLGSIILSSKGKSHHTTGYDIVDGQQRTISLLLISFCFHSLVSKLLEEDEYKGNTRLNSIKDELSDQILKRCSLLKREDSEDKDIKYILHTMTKQTSSCPLNKTEILSREKTEKFLTRTLQHILSITDESILVNSKIFDSIFEQENKESLKISDEIASGLIDKIKLFYKHFMRNVIFIELVVSENYAYDVFERFNTAGDPLTAFETFRPLVIADINQDRIDQKYKRHIDEIGNILKRWSKDSDRDKERNKINKNIQSFIIWFGYLFSGGIEQGNKRKPIEKHLSAQRTYLREKYKNCNIKEKGEFIECMYKLSRFINDCWSVENNNLNYNDFIPIESKTEEVKNIIDECAFCLDFLRDINHTISIPLLAYFFRLFLEDKTQTKLEDFINIVKACSAFFCIWRSSRHSTGAIDEKYRYMYFGDQKKEKKGLFEKDNEWTVESIKNYFKECLKENRDYPILSYKEWMNKTIEVKLGSKLTKVAKFILLTASHDTKVYKCNLKRERGILPLINDDSWSNSTYKTLEHLIPLERGKQEIQSKQLEKVGVDTTEEYLKIIDSLGNLTLIPRKLNSKLKDRELSEKIKVIKSRSKKEEPYLPLLDFLKKLDVSKYNKKYIKDRTNNLISLSWDILAKDWLGWKD